MEVCPSQFILAHMKRYALILTACLLFAQLASAQEFLKNSPFKNTFNTKDVQKAIEKLKECYKVENGGVSFIQIIDSLPHNASAIHSFAAEYFDETYKITKYEVRQNNPEKCFIIGEGEFNSFESYAAYPNQYIFTCNPDLRIDAKDGRVRLCIYVKEYKQIRSNGNIREEKEVNVTDVSPVNPDNDDSEKMYNKVFLALAQKAFEVFEDFSDFIHDKRSEDIEDW